jgi:DnaJ-class molecular chaperone
MNVCAHCNGKGAVRSVYPSRRDHPCYWFSEGARTCPKCDGTGEADDRGDCE